MVIPKQNMWDGHHIGGDGYIETPVKGPGKRLCHCDVPSTRLCREAGLLPGTHWKCAHCGLCWILQVSDGGLPGLPRRWVWKLV